MIERTMFAVIADALSTELTQFKLSSRLTELDENGIKELVETLANDNPAWNDVLNNSRIAVIFDAESGDKISINQGSKIFS